MKQNSLNLKSGKHYSAGKYPAPIKEAGNDCENDVARQYFQKQRLEMLMGLLPEFRELEARM